MLRCTGIAIALVGLCCAQVAEAQQKKGNLNDLMANNLNLEKNGKYREAYIEWATFLKMPAINGGNLRNKDVQKIYYSAYYYYSRTCFRMAVHDPKIINRQRFIDAAAKMIVNLETSKVQLGWEISGPMFQDLLKEKESESLKKAYDSLKPQAPQKK